MPKGAEIVCFDVLFMDVLFMFDVSVVVMLFAVCFVLLLGCICVMCVIVINV